MFTIHSRTIKNKEDSKKKLVEDSANTSLDIRQEKTFTKEQIKSGLDREQSRLDTAQADKTNWSDKLDTAKSDLQTAKDNEDEEVIQEAEKRVTKAKDRLSEAKDRASTRTATRDVWQDRLDYLNNNS